MNMNIQTGIESLFYRLAAMFAPKIDSAAIRRSFDAANAERFDLILRVNDRTHIRRELAPRVLIWRLMEYGADGASVEVLSVAASE